MTKHYYTKGLDIPQDADSVRYPIPEGYTAKVENGALILMPKESEDEKIREEIVSFIRAFWVDHRDSVPQTSKWLDWLERQKEQKPIKMEVYEVGKGTTICGQDYKCKKDYKEGNCWYIKDVIYHCSRDGYLNDQNGVSWSCTPEWFKEYIYSNAEWAEKEKSEFVGGQFIQCNCTLDNGLKKGEHYWLEYVGDDTYVGRSDNILNQKFHITPRQLFTLFSQELEEVQGLPQEEKQVPLNYEPPFDENPSDKEIIEALIHNLNEQDGFLTAINCVSTKAILNWLEKQKEQKLEWSEEDSRKIGTLSSIIADYAFHKDALDENNDLTGEYAELDNWLGTLPERFNLQPKQEWNEDWREEDIQTRFAFYTYKDDPSTLYLSNVFVEEASRNYRFGTRILRAAEKVAETIGATTISLKVKQDSPANAWYRKNGFGYVTFEDGYDWLEKNLEYMKPTKSAEWSEEDEIRLKEALEVLNESIKYLPFGYGYTKDVRLVTGWLKSLRPSWKPSEEQIEALEWMLTTVTMKDGGYGVVLKNLVNDLKKM